MTKRRPTALVDSDGRLLLLVYLVWCRRRLLPQTVTVFWRVDN